MCFGKTTRPQGPRRCQARTVHIVKSSGGHCVTRRSHPSTCSAVTAGPLFFFTFLPLAAPQASRFSSLTAKTASTALTKWPAAPTVDQKHLCVVSGRQNQLVAGADPSSIPPPSFHPPVSNNISSPFFLIQCWMDLRGSNVCFICFSSSASCWGYDEITRPYITASCRCGDINKNIKLSTSVRGWFKFEHEIAIS